MQMILLLVRFVELDPTLRLDRCSVSCARKDRPATSKCNLITPLAKSVHLEVTRLRMGRSSVSPATMDTVTV